jgi:hypothetical protein
MSASGKLPHINWKLPKHVSAVNFSKKVTSSFYIRRLFSS